ncbi:MAG: aminotransferase class I/II-fold pyridoxal phosphate-dependent enzyme [Candidatus Aenigmarchaeota archaeon]|nr:aminotransferase class I/II-fold pyridoxal phosphate-dependent enzyme [Candidatus Aenigmarchaeota archaeon]
MLRKIPRTRISTPSNFLEIIKHLFFSVHNDEAVNEFEEKFAEYIKVKNVIATSSGKLSLYLILNSLNLDKNDEIILPAYTSVSVPNVIMSSNLTPVFTDISHKTLNINENLIGNKVTIKTRCILPTHIYGQPCEMNRIMKIAKKHNLYVIEDCAHACGSEYNGKKVGSVGDFGFFSFGFGKHISTLGGGAITTNNDYVAEQIRKKIKKFKKPSNFELLKKIFRAYIIKFFTYPDVFSFTLYPFILFFGSETITKIFEENTRLMKNLPSNCVRKFSDFQAIIGVKEISRLDDRNNERIKNAELYTKHLKSIINIQDTLPRTKSAYLNYAILVDYRKDVIKKMIKNGVDTQRTWMKNCSSLEISNNFKNDCPVSEEVAKKVIYLPLYPELNKSEILKIVDVLKS